MYPDERWDYLIIPDFFPMGLLSGAQSQKTAFTKVLSVFVSGTAFFHYPKSVMAKMAQSIYDKLNLISVLTGSRSSFRT